MAKIGRHREHLPLIFWFRVGHKFTKGHRMHGDTLFDQAKEEHAPMRGFAPVEPEREFVQIGLLTHIRRARQFTQDKFVLVSLL